MACLLFRYETFALADRARGADPLIGASLRDLRSAWRGLLKRKASSTGAMLILALAIGSNVAIFGVIHSVLLRPLPERDEVLAAAAGARLSLGDRLRRARASSAANRPDGGPEVELSSGRRRKG